MNLSQLTTSLGTNALISTCSNTIAYINQLKENLMSQHCKVIAIPNEILNMNS